MFRIYILLITTFTTLSLFSQISPKLILPIGHISAINSANFNPNGQKVVTASTDGTAKIWEVSSGKLIANLTNNSFYVNIAQYSKNGQKIITASDKVVEVWDANSGQLITNFIGHKDGVAAAEFSPDGMRIVTASRDSTAKIWDALNGKLIVDLKGHNGEVRSTKFSPDGMKIVTASMDSSAKVWDAITGKLIADLKGHTNNVRYANFSSDGMKIVTASFDSTAKIWDASTGKLIANIVGHKNTIRSVEFSPDGERILTSSPDSTAKIWNAATGKLIVDLQGHNGGVISTRFSPDGMKIVTASRDRTAKVWDASTGKLIADLNCQTGIFRSAEFSSDGKQITTASDGSAEVWDVKTGKLIRELAGHTKRIFITKFSNDGKLLVTVSMDGIATIWDAKNGKLITKLKGNTFKINSAEFSPDGMRIVTASWDSTAKIWDAKTGMFIIDLKHEHLINSTEFSLDGKRLVTTSYDRKAKIWDVESGKLIIDIKLNNIAYSAKFSPDGKRVVTANDSTVNSTVKIWDAKTGELITNLTRHKQSVRSAKFSPDGEKILTASNDSSSIGIPMLWNVVTGKLISNLLGHTWEVLTSEFSPDGMKIVTASMDSTAKIWDANSGKLIANLGHTKPLYSAKFSPDGMKIMTVFFDGTANFWDANSYELKANISDIQSHRTNDPEFSPDGQRVVTATEDGTAKVWDANTGNMLYSFFAVDSSDYLVYDKDFHYDGTEGARKMLYFTCGSEIIELDQIKDQLWVPGLAERIMKGETIEAKKLVDLDICNLIPQVEEQTNLNGQEYIFDILPQRGGIGKTILYVNEFPVKTYLANDLIKTSTGYQLRIARSEVTPNFIAGQSNQVSVRSFIANNSIGSRGGHIIDSELKKQKPPAPNLYAVMIGVSDYKGKGLDLTYAAKDANDLSSALSISARKLLNYDEKEHVFVYNLTTNEVKYKLPEKEAIRKLLQEIGTKTKPNDILVMFFAGHGVMGGEANKQFYFLTADASDLTATENPSEVGISMLELMDWVKLQNINAQKRVLILDACNSGQAIKDFVKIGGNEQGYIAARSDERSQQIKAIDKLNDQAGFTILSASASSQSAYEMGRYSQGLLTYSLLRAIKLQPDILEQGKYLDVNRWFGAAEKTVVDISNNSGQRQEPQLVSSNNFNLGVVDEEVLRKIILPQEKPLFGPANLQNADETISSDDLELGKLIQNEMADISSRNVDAKILFDMKLKSDELWTISGRYEVQNKKISVRVNVKQGKQTPKYRFEMTGNTDNLKGLSESIVRKTISLVIK